MLVLHSEQVRKLLGPAQLGTGVQGREHLDAFHLLFPTAALRVAGRTQQTARALATAYDGVEVAESFDRAVAGADVVCLCTDAEGPVIARDWLADGCHV